MGIIDSSIEYGGGGLVNRLAASRRDIPNSFDGPS